jgi:hypothetical protein
MAVLTKSTAPPPSLATLTPPPGCQLTKNAFTDLAAGDMVYIKSDDTFALANGTANDALAQWWGMVKRSAKAGSPVTAFHSCEFQYSTGLAIGARYYVSTTPGALADVATLGGDIPCAFATSATNVYVMAPRK